MKATQSRSPYSDLARSYQNWVQSALSSANQFVQQAAGGGPASACEKSCPVPCCPPDIECPPHCLATLQRTAREGEVIVDSFSVKNCCGGRRTYKVGVRPMLDEDGKAAPQQPKVDKTQVTLEKGQSILVRIKLDTSGLQVGSRYSGEFVLREKDVNQNVCFRLELQAAPEGPEVCPLDEDRYFNHFQSWDSHFYCEQPRLRINAENQH